MEARSGSGYARLICTLLAPDRVSTAHHYPALLCHLLLCQVVKNPVTSHLPTGCQKIGTSFNAEKMVELEDYATDKPVAFVVGAMAHGKVTADYMEEEVAISEYPLSAALTCTKLCCSFEKAWGIK